MSFFSVIIPTYNRAHTLERALKSVLRQRFTDYDIWVVDDGSTDQTAQVLKLYADKINVFQTENKGVSAARNLGIQNSTGKWLAFLDSDDEWLEEKLQKQYEFIQHNPETPLVHGEEIWIRNGVRVNPKNKHKKFGGKIFSKCLPLCLISPSAAVLKRELFTEVGYFREDFPVCEDYDLWLKITSIYEVGFVEDVVLYKYGGHQDQLSQKFHAMDSYRVKSMAWILSNRTLSKRDEELLRSELSAKLEILALGYQKHGRADEFKMLSTQFKDLHDFKSLSLAQGV